MNRFGTFCPVEINLPGLAGSAAGFFSTGAGAGFAGAGFADAGGALGEISTGETASVFVSGGRDVA